MRSNLRNLAGWLTFWAVVFGLCAVSGRASDFLSMTYAKRASVQVTQEIVDPFTERQPVIHVTCHRERHSEARCVVRFKADRLSGTLRTHVVRDGVVLIVYGSHLHVQ